MADINAESVRSQADRQSANMHSSEACSLHFANFINLKTSLEIRDFVLLVSKICLTVSKLCSSPKSEVYFTSEGKQDEKTSNIEQM